MATSSSDDIPAQLAALLGNAVVPIRKTKELPPRVSIYDVIAAVTGLTGNHAGKAYRDLAMKYSEVHSIGVNFRFPGRGQRDTPVCEVRGIVEIIMILPGRHAAQVRKQAADLLCRWLGGDLSLVDEVCTLRASRSSWRPEHPTTRADSSERRLKPLPLRAHSWPTCSLP